MQFINPRTDLAFKKIFGSEESKPVLISFLNGILHQGESIIVDLDIVDPYSIPRLEGLKDSYLDVRTHLRDGHTVLVEMQVLNVQGFEKRVLYNAAKEYSNQLKVGMDYSLLNPVIGLTITDFVMFPESGRENEVISTYKLKEEKTLADYPDNDLALVFVELPKFNKKEGELEGLTDKWLYFMNITPDLTAVPAGLGEIPEIQKAFEIANYASLTEEEERRLEKKVQWIADQKRFEKRSDKTQKELQEAKQELGTAKQELGSAKQELGDTRQELQEAQEQLDAERQKAEQLAQRLREAGLEP